VERLKSDLAVSRAREAAMQAAYTARSDEAARFRQEATHVRAEVVRLGEEATGLRAEVARLGEETVGLRADVARLHDEAAQLRDETGALGRRLALAEQTAAALALERDAIHNSTSWRLTRPVRWLRGWLPDRWFRR
jgi:chromosome segregation ATPase